MIDHGIVVCVLVPPTLTGPTQSGTVRGRQLFDYLRTRFEHVYFNPSFSRIQEYDESVTIVYILMKHINNFVPPTLLGRKNKLVIWDPVDTFYECHDAKSLYAEMKSRKSSTRSDLHFHHADIINPPNRAMRDDFEQLIQNQTQTPPNKTIVFIPHNWDVRSDEYHATALSNEDLDHVSIGFLGTPNNPYDVDLLKHASALGIRNLGRVIRSQDIGTFNVCMCLRTKKAAYNKPSIKSYVAASMNCCVIASRNESGIVEMFGEDYPYYVGNNDGFCLEDISKTIQYVKDTFKTPVWYKALAAAKDVRRRTSIEYVGNQFADLIIERDRISRLPTDN